MKSGDALVAKWYALKLLSKPMINYTPDLIYWIEYEKVNRN